MYKDLNDSTEKRSCRSVSTEFFWATKRRRRASRRLKQSRPRSKEAAACLHAAHRLINLLINLIKHYEKALFTVRFLGTTCVFKGCRPEYKHWPLLELSPPGPSHCDERSDLHRSSQEDVLIRVQKLKVNKVL